MLARLLICCLLALLGTRAAAVPALQVTGGPDVVFDWERDRCATWDIPDAPARAWRTEEGKVGLLAGSEATRASRGPTLDDQQRDCQVLHRGMGSDDPADWNDRTWIAAVHAQEGGVMIALAHMEYHGHLRPDDCPSGRYADCWFNAVVELRSTDGGRTFWRKGGGDDLVVALPQRYRGDAPHRMGFFNPSNILVSDGNLYAFVFAEEAGPQRRGPCLIRRPVTGGPGDWRAWDGTGFTVRFVDPYRVANVLATEHACRPVEGLRSTVSSVVRHEGRGLFLAVTPMTAADGRSGIFWSRSADLIRWSEPQLLYEAPLLWRRDCAKPDAYAYPSLIDPDSPSRGFDTTDDSLWLYLVRMPLDATCAVTARRDLVRFPIRWHDDGSPP